MRVASLMVRRAGIERVLSFGVRWTKKETDASVILRLPPRYKVLRGKGRSGMSVLKTFFFVDSASRRTRTRSTAP